MIAPTRKKLYYMIQSIYDLPNYGPVCSQEYLAELVKPDGKYLKVMRSETHTLPKGSRRNWNSIETFNLLVRTLDAKGKKPCGFTHFSLPNIEWMLRMIIWADPSLKSKIVEKTTSDSKGKTVRQQEIETKQVAVDPVYVFHSH